MENFKVAEGTYVPDMGLTYDTQDPYVRMYKPVYDRVCKVDENYDFIGKSWETKRRWFAYPIVLNIGVGAILYFRSGLRIKGREILKQYKKELSGGYITISNHMHPHDCEAVLIATKAKSTTKIPMFQKNFETKVQYFLQLVGGVPIPPAEEGLSAMKRFNEAFDYFHEQGYALHIFPEMSKWPWYTPLRPFQKGAFTMAYKYNIPLLPCTITYRKRTGIYRLFGPKEEPLITVTIGQPVFPDKSVTRKQDVDRMLTQSHQQMTKMMHIIQNPWPAMPE